MNKHNIEKKEKLESNNQETERQAGAELARAQLKLELKLSLTSFKNANVTPSECQKNANVTRSEC